MSLGGGTAWIGGGTMTQHGNDFVWLDHTPITINGSGKYGWWASQPGPAGHGDCLKTGIDRHTKEFGWQTFHCNYQYAFICEMARVRDGGSAVAAENAASDEEGEESAKSSEEGGGSAETAGEPPVAEEERGGSAETEVVGGAGNSTKSTPDIPE